MARIYAKPIAGGFDNTLILDSREALVIPFTFSGDYSVVRMTMFASLTSGTFDNIGSSINHDETVSVNNNTRNRVYFGFMDRDGFPGESGCTFIGLATSSGDPISRVRIGQTSIPSRWGGGGASSCSLMLINPTGGAEEATNQRFTLTMSEGPFLSGTGNYNSILGIEVGFSNKGQSSQRCDGYSYNASSLGPSTGYNDLFAATFGGLGVTYSSVQTIGYAHSGVALTLPKYAIVYNPFGNARLRIHGLGIFKVG